MIEITRLENDSITIRPDGLFSRQIVLSTKDIEKIRKGYMYIFATQQVLEELNRRIDTGRLPKEILHDADYVEKIVSAYHTELLKVDIPTNVNNTLLQRAFNEIP